MEKIPVMTSQTGGMAFETREVDKVYAGSKWRPEARGFIFERDFSPITMRRYKMKCIRTVKNPN